MEQLTPNEILAQSVQELTSELEQAREHRQNKELREKIVAAAAVMGLIVSIVWLIINIVKR